MSLEEFSQWWEEKGAAYFAVLGPEDAARAAYMQGQYDAYTQSIMLMKDIEVQK